MGKRTWQPQSRGPGGEQFIKDNNCHNNNNNNNSINKYNYKDIQLYLQIQTTVMKTALPE
jgi:hypothetical protein